MRKLDFEDVIIERGDAIENAAHDLIVALANKDVEWKLYIIRDIIEYAQERLEKENILCCNPYYSDDETPCYKLDECKCAECPVKGGGSVG